MGRRTIFASYAKRMFINRNSRPKKSENMTQSIAIRIRITDVYIGVTHTIGTNNLQGDDSEVMFGRDFALMSVR